MNSNKILSINDPFRAAYLLRFGQYKTSQFKDGQRSYLIAGDAQTLAEENYRYRTGYAMVNPLELLWSGETEAGSAEEQPDKG